MKPTLVQSIKAAAISAVIAVIANHIWNLIATKALGAVAPSGPWLIAITFSSMVPLLLAGTLYYLLERFTSKGALIFTSVSVLLTFLSLYSSFMTVMPDGTPVPAGFPVLSVPMHLIAGFSAAFGIPRFSK